MPANAPHYLIEGGAPLYGEVRLSGAKNAVTKMVMASLLTVEPCILRNVPLLGDLDLAIGLCRDLGAEIDLQDHTLSIRTPHINKVSVSSEIGRRPIDFHLNGLREMGAGIIERNGRYYCSAPRGLHGVTINLPFPSVMATENFLITASLVKGVTIIQNAALEPEIIDLIKLLQKMGAIIEIKVDRRIFVEGVERLHGASHTLLSDRNEAVSLATAAYLTKGDVYLRGAQQDTLLTFLNTLSKMQLHFAVDDEGIRFTSDAAPPPPIALETDVHPGVMTDWQQPFTVLLTH